MPSLVTTQGMAELHGSPSLASSRLRSGAAAVAATALVAVCAHVSVALPFTPVPIVLSDFAVLVVGLLLGPGAAFAVLLLYLAEGAVGLPVFSPHGLGGVAQMLGPTGGFLLSYPVVAAVAGFIYRRTRSRLPVPAAALLGAAIATLPLFLAGAGWLALLLHLSPARAAHLAIWPFLPAAGVKVAAAAGLVASLHGIERLNRQQR